MSGGFYGQHDKALRLHSARANQGQVRFKRWPSFTAAGISFEDFLMTPAEQKEAEQLIKHYRDKYTRLMMSKFKNPVFSRADAGPLVNIDEAIEGIPECYRRMTKKARAPLRIGINVSRCSSSVRIVSVRGGAILALMQLCKARNQATQIEVCYGNGMCQRRCSDVGHIRIAFQNPNPTSLIKVCCSGSAISVVGRCVNAVCDRWVGGYRFWEFFDDPQFPREYDFYLDRIDSSCAKTEEERVIKQLEAFKLL